MHFDSRLKVGEGVHMTIEKYWENPVRKIQAALAYLVYFQPIEKLPYRISSIVTKIFWGYHFVLLGATLLLSEYVNSEHIRLAVIPLFVFWISYFIILVCYGVLGAVVGFYEHLKNAGLPPPQCLLISFLSAVGLISLLVWIKN